MYHIYSIKSSAIAWQNVFFGGGGGGGGANLAERNQGESGGKALEILEIFIP